MGSLKIKLGTLFLFCFKIYAVKSLTEEELAPFLKTFEEQLFQKWENNYMKEMKRKLSAATTDIPEIKTAIQGTEVISRPYWSPTNAKPTTNAYSTNTESTKR